jgi:hypothetical protein
MPARKLPAATDGNGSISAADSRGPCEFRLITIETRTELPQRLPHDGNMKTIAEHATVETDMSSWLSSFNAPVASEYGFRFAMAQNALISS